MKLLCGSIPVLLLLGLLLFCTCYVHAWPKQWCEDHKAAHHKNGPPHDHDGHDGHDEHDKCDKLSLQPPICIGSARYETSQFVVQQNVGQVVVGLDSVYAKYDCNLTNVDPFDSNCRVPFVGSTINASCCCAAAYMPPGSGAPLQYLYKLKVLSPSGVVSLQSELLVPSYCPQPQDHPVITEKDVNNLISIPGTPQTVIANKFRAEATPCGAISIQSFAQKPYIFPPP